MFPYQCAQVRFRTVTWHSIVATPSLFKLICRHTTLPAYRHPGKHRRQRTYTSQDISSAHMSGNPTDGKHAASEFVTRVQAWSRPIPRMQATSDEEDTL